MRRDQIVLRLHGIANGLWHVVVIAGLAGKLWSNGWDVKTTMELRTKEGVNGPELDIFATRPDKKVDGNRRTSITRTIGVEVEESYDMNNIIIKYEKYKLFGIETMFVVVPGSILIKDDFGRDALNRPRDIRIQYCPGTDLLKNIEAVGEAIF